MDHLIDAIVDVHKATPPLQDGKSNPSKTDKDEDDATVTTAMDASYQCEWNSYDGSSCLRRMGSITTASSFFSSTPTTPEKKAKSRFLLWGSPGSEDFEIDSLLQDKCNTSYDSCSFGVLSQPSTPSKSSSEIAFDNDDGSQHSTYASLQKEYERIAIIKTAHEKRIQELERLNASLKGEKEELLSKQRTDDDVENITRLKQELDESRRHVEVLQFAWNESKNTHSMDVDIYGDKLSNLQTQLENYKAENIRLRNQIEDSRNPSAGPPAEVRMVTNTPTRDEVNVDQVALPERDSASNRQIIEEKKDGIESLPAYGQVDQLFSTCSSCVDETLAMPIEKEREIVQNRLVRAAQEIQMLQDQILSFQGSSMGLLYWENEMFQQVLDGCKEQINELEGELISTKEETTKIQKKIHFRFEQYKQKIKMSRTEMTQAKAWIYAMLDGLGACQDTSRHVERMSCETDASNEMLREQLDGWIIQHHCHGDGKDHPGYRRVKHVLHQLEEERTRVRQAEVEKWTITKKCDALRNENEHLQNEIESSRRRAVEKESGYSLSQDMLQREVGELVNFKATLEGEVNSLRKKINERDHHDQVLCSEYRHLLQRAEENYEATIKQLQQVKDDNATLSEANIVTKKSLNECGTTIAALQSENTLLREQADSYRLRISQMKSQSSSDLEQLMVTNTKLRDEIDTLRQARDQERHKSRMRLEEQRLLLEENHASARTKMDKLSADNQKLLGQMKSLEESLESQDDKLATLRFEKSCLRQDLDIELQKSQKAEQQLWQITSERNLWYDEVMQLREKIDSHHAESVRTATHHATTLANLQASMDEMSSVNSKLEGRLEDEKAEHEQKVSELKAVTEGLGNRILDLQSENDTLRNEKKALVERNDHLEDATRESQNKVSKLESDVVGHEMQIFDLQYSKDRLIKESDNLRKQVSSLEESRDVLSRQVQDVEKKQTDCINELHTTLFGI